MDLVFITSLVEMRGRDILKIPAKSRASKAAKLFVGAEEDHPSAPSHVQGTYQTFSQHWQAWVLAGSRCQAAGCCN